MLRACPIDILIEDILVDDLVVERRLEVLDGLPVIQSLLRTHLRELHDFVSHET